MEIVRASNYSMGCAYHNTPEIGHDDPFNSLAVKAKYRSHCPILAFLGIAHLYGPKKYSKPQELYSLTNPFAVRVVGKFHSIPWLGD